MYDSCMISNHVPLIFMIFRISLRMTFRMTLRMTSKTWDFPRVFNEDFEGDFEGYFKESSSGTFGGNSLKFM